MVHIGITYNPSLELFTSGYNQTALVLVEVFQLLGYRTTLVDTKNGDRKWWTDYPKMDATELVNMCDLTTELDYLIDIDGFVHPDTRNAVSKKSIVFLRTFLQFSELDNSVYPEMPYMPRSFEGVHEVWCWDIFNPPHTLDSVQTLFPCRIRTVPFIWSANIAQNYSNRDKNKGSGTDLSTWSVHISEKNTTSSSCLFPLVAIRDLHLNNVFDSAKYIVHNAEKVKENKFFQENVLNNIEISKLPVEWALLEPYYKLGEKDMIFSHSRFTPMRIGLLNAIWLGIPLIHNSPIIAGLHPVLHDMFYFGNEMLGIQKAFSYFKEHPSAIQESIGEIQEIILRKWGASANREKWGKVFEELITTSPTMTAIKIPKTITIAFSDMWPGFNYDSNFIIDAMRHEVHNGDGQNNVYIQGVEYNSNKTPHLVVFGPYNNQWKSIPDSIPKVYFSAENWAQPNDSSSSIKLFLTPSRTEDSRHMRIPTWATFIDWYSGSKTLPEGTLCDDNPIRIPLYFATNPHPIGFKDRTDFCGFVVSNPICKFRNDTFYAVNSYKPVASGGELFNNIGGRLALKYPGGGCGDISKLAFFAKHRFTISFENSQSLGYITEKVLHSKMAGCVPLYWGDSDTDTDFVPNSFINLSGISEPDRVVEVIKTLETNEDFCSLVASTPILNDEKVSNALQILSNMSKRLLALCGHGFTTGFDKVKVINLDTRKDRWDNLVKAEPYIAKMAERVSAVNGKDIVLTEYIYDLFKNNNYKWKKSVMGCALSHIRVWTQLLNEPESIKSYLILEDDVRFDELWLNTWTSMANEIPDDAELLYLGGVLPPNKPALASCIDIVNSSWAKIKPNTFFSATGCEPIFHFCAYSYILTKKGAKKLIDALIHSDYKCFTGIDHFLNFTKIGLVNYIAWPQIARCFQDDDPVYCSANFNNLERKDTYDSDIWNNKECFSEDEVSVFSAKPVQTLTLYHYPQNEPYELYERTWLEDIFKCQISLKPMDNLRDFKPKSTEWFIVQRPYVGTFNEYFQMLSTAGIDFKVVHISDEFLSDDCAFYSLPNCKRVVRNYVGNKYPKLQSVIPIPLGYHYKGNPCRKFEERKLVWSFYGTGWFRREEKLNNLVDLVPHKCHLIPEWNHSSMIKEEQYLATLNDSKFCPILRGNNFETFRFYECLESGAIPLYVRQDGDSLYWSWISEKLDLANLTDWDSARDHIQYYLSHPDYAEEYRCKLIQKWREWKDSIQIYNVSEFDELENRNDYENHSVEKQKILDNLKKIIIDSKSGLEGNSFYIHESLNLYPDLYTKQLNLFWCGKQAIKKICEIGFNAGHSTMLLLLGGNNKPLDFTIFDIGIHPYTKPCINYIQSHFSQINFEYIEGDSTVTMPKWIEANVTQIGSYDVVHVDGGHSENCISNDIKNADSLVKKGGIVIIDDTNIEYINKYVDLYISTGRYREMNVLKTNGYPHRIIRKNI